MGKHVWVELRYMPVEPVANPDGSVDIMVREGHQKLAESEAKVGCWFCNTPVSSDNVDEECLGEAMSS